MDVYRQDVLSLSSPFFGSAYHTWCRLGMFCLLALYLPPRSAYWNVKCINAGILLSSLLWHVCQAMAGGE